MIKRLKNTPRLAWMVVGGCIAALLIPSAAVASGLIYNGIKGPSGNKADVSTASQLLTAPATPANYFANTDVAINSGTFKEVATPPTNDGLVVTSVNLSVYSDPSPGTTYVELIVAGEPSCGFVGESSFEHGVYPTTVGSSQLTFDPGIVVPAGDALCADTNNGGAYVDATGWVGPSAAIPPSAG